VTPLKIIFAGTPDFAAVALHALIDSAHQIIAVYTQPDRPSGRGLKLTPSPVKTLALQHHLPVYQPTSLKNVEEQTRLANFEADVMVVAAYGMLLPQVVLDMPRLGCINIHPSLLPRWRGAAPIPRTIFAGDKMTGVTIMQMDAGLDTGPMLLQKAYTLMKNETAQSLHDKLAKLGATLLLETLYLLATQQIKPVPQDNALATYAHKMTKAEALVDWHDSAISLEQKIRAFNPWPIAYTEWQAQPLRIWQAQVLTEKTDAVPGVLIKASEEGLDIATGEGTLRLLQLQLPGGKILKAADFYHAKQAQLKIGEKFSE